MGKLKKTILIAGISAGSILGADAITLNEIPIDIVIESDNIIQAKQIANQVELDIGWYDNEDIKFKYDMGEPTLEENLRDKRNIQPVVATEGDTISFDWILNEKPKDNNFCIQVEGYENYEAHYQPPLTEEFTVGEFEGQDEIAQVTATSVISTTGEVIVSRPDNVVGSYAVYHKSKRDNQYKTGKHSHWYYPYYWQIGDEANKQRAENFTYDNSTGELCVTVNRQFLNKADYTQGVYIDPTFGYSTVGGSDINLNAGEFRGTSTTTPADVGAVQSLTAHVGDQSGPGDMAAKGAIFLTSSLTAVISNGLSAETVTSDKTYHDENFTFGTDPVPSASTSYVIGLVANVKGKMKYDTVTGGGTGYTNFSTSYTAPDISGAVTDSNRLYTVYANYTNDPPTVALNTPADAATGQSTTPTLVFTGSDTESNDIRYNVQIDTVSTFDSQTAVPTLVASSSVAGANGGTTGAVDTTGATLLVVGVAVDDADSPTISDSKSNTWTELTSYTATNVRVRIFYVANPTVGTGHTFTVTSTGGAPSAHFAAFDNIKATSPFDQQNGSNNDSTTTLQPGSITPTEDGELLFTVLGVNNSGSPMSINLSFTEIDETDFSGGSNYGSASAYLIQTSAAAINPTWTRTNTNEMAASIASFKQSGAPLIDVVSGTDAGFANVDTPADTDPFNAGDQADYDVQTTLNNSTTYYWRVRGIDPSGSNTYGAWSSTRSFTTEAGGGGGTPPYNPQSIFWWD